MKHHQHPVRRRLAGPAAVVAVSLVALAGCGSNTSTGAHAPTAASKTFSSAAVPFSFRYPAALASCAPFGGAVAVLGYCSSTATFGISSIDDVAVASTEITPSFAGIEAILHHARGEWSSVAIERHGQVQMVVAHGLRRAGYPYSGYYFIVGRKVWNLQCMASPLHENADVAACAEAVNSVQVPTAKR